MGLEAGMPPPPEILFLKALLTDPAHLDRFAGHLKEFRFDDLFLSFF